MSSDSEDEVLAICCGAASAAALLVVSNQVSDMTTTDHMICHAFCSRIQMLIDKDVETVHSIIIKKMMLLLGSIRKEVLVVFSLNSEKVSSK